MLRITKLQKLAIRAGSLPAIESWRNNQPITDARDDDGNSLLMIAARYGKNELVKYFIEQGINITAQNNEGVSAADLAINHGHNETYNLLISKSEACTTKPIQNSDQTSREVSTDSNWEAEIESQPPKHDQELSNAAANEIQDLIHHKPIDKDLEWTNIQISLPKITTLNDSGSEFASVEELLYTHIKNGEEIDNIDYLIAIENDLNILNHEIPSFFWDALPDRLGLNFDPFHSSFLLFDSQIGIKPFFNETEIRELITDTLNQHRQISEIWKSRFIEQFQIREILDKEKEQRLGQRMDSAILAIRRILQSDENIGLQNHIRNYLANQYDIEADSFSESFEMIDEELVKNSELEVTHESDQESFDYQITINFFDFILNPHFIDDGDFTPPRPSTEHINILNNLVTQKQPILLKEINNHYNRYIEARNQFLLSNLRLVMHVSKNYRTSHHIAIEDYFQMGIEGLLKAIEKYNYRLGFKFSTYATWWIKQSIMRGIGNQSNTIRLPVHAFELKRKYDEAVLNTNLSEFAFGYNQPNHEFSKEQINKIEKMSHSFIDINDMDCELEKHDDFCITDEIKDPFETVYNGKLKAIINDHLEKLEPRAAKVIKMRFGLDGMSECTLEEVGQCFNLTRERIRQIESKALSLLSKPYMLKFLNGIDEMTEL